MDIHLNIWFGANVSCLNKDVPIQMWYSTLRMLEKFSLSLKDRCRCWSLTWVRTTAGSSSITSLMSESGTYELSVHSTRTRLTGNVEFTEGFSFPVKATVSVKGTYICGIFVLFCVFFYNISSKYLLSVSLTSNYRWQYWPWKINIIQPFVFNDQTVHTMYFY